MEREIKKSLYEKEEEKKLKKNSVKFKFLYGCYKNTFIPFYRV
jgi:hypothetical protein